MRDITLAFSPCPNDIFIFYGLMQGKIDLPFSLQTRLLDVEKLNAHAEKSSFPATKLSCFAWGKVAKEYVMLRSGAALGWGCGPLLLSRHDRPPQANAKIAIPGELTTAHFIFRLFWGKNYRSVPIIFDQIMPAMERKEIAYGLVIHEGRFLYRQHNLHLIEDLGDRWEKSFSLPLPLGVIAARRDLGEEQIFLLEKAIASSIEYAYAHPEEVYSYIKERSSHMDTQMIADYISLYVNEDTKWLKEKGEEAIIYFFKQAESMQLLPKLAERLPLFTAREEKKV